MGMGLQAAYGAEALQQLLRQQVQDRIAEQQRLKGDTQQSFENDLRTKQFQSGEELKQAQLASMNANQKAAESDRQDKGDIALGDTIPAGNLSPDAPAPLVGRLQRIGLIDDSKARPEVETGPLLPGDTGMARGVLKLASSKQQATQDSADAKVEAARLATENRDNENEQKAKDRLAQIAAAAAARPVADKLTKVEHQDANGKTVIEWLPQSEIKGKTYNKGVTGATETRLASAQAVNQTGNDIIAKLSDPNVAAVIGPAMGRYQTLRDFIGNPPPEFSELAGQIESYAIANMGVHGMRSVQGADQIKKLLDTHHTPESLAATIRGLSGFSQHFMQNEGRGGAAPTAPAASAPKPTAADLIKKYGGD